MNDTHLNGFLLDTQQSFNLYFCSFLRRQNISHNTRWGGFSRLISNHNLARHSPRKISKDLTQLREYFPDYWRIFCAAICFRARTLTFPYTTEPKRETKLTSAACWLSALFLLFWLAACSRLSFVISRVQPSLDSLWHDSAGHGSDLLHYELWRAAQLVVFTARSAMSQWISFKIYPPPMKTFLSGQNIFCGSTHSKDTTRHSITSFTLNSPIIPSQHFLPGRIGGPKTADHPHSR